MKHYACRIADFCLIIFLFVCPMLFSTVAQSAEQVILKVTVNGHNEGEHFLLLTESNDILVSPEFLTGIRLREELWAEKGEKKISLKSLAPELQFTADHNNAVLTLAVDPLWFESRDIRRPATNRTPASHNMIQPRPFSAFFNYRLQADFTEKDGFNNYTMPLELGINWKKCFAFSNFISYQGDYQNDFSRQTSGVIWDDPSKMRHLVLGDFNAPSTNLLNGGMFGGISWGSRFTLDRSFRPYPGLKFETLIETPTRAELYSNGQVIREWDLLPGPVSFSDIEMYAGGNAELLLRDAFGRVQRLDLPALMGNQNLLRKGLHEYSYNLGFARKDFGKEDNKYDYLTLQGFHRYGFSERFTQGVLFALQEDILNLGAETGLRLGDHLFNTEGMYSYNDGENGYALSLNHTFRWRRFSSYLSLWEYSRNFTRPSAGFSSANESPRYMRNLTLNHAWQKLGSLSVGYNEYCQWNEEAELRMTVSYSKTLFRHISMSLSMRFGLENSEEEEILLSFSYYPRDEKSRKYYDSMGYRFQDTKNGSEKHEIGIQKSTGIGRGFGYNLVLNQEEEDTGGSLRAEYRGESGILTGYFQQSPGSSSNGYLSAAGGIGLLDNSLYFGRPVTDSFAVVEVEGLDNVPVYQNSSLAGILDDGDTLFVPSLVSYDENRISIRPEDLPLNYEFTDKIQYIEVGQRSGSRVKFKGFIFKAAEGNLYIALPDGKHEPLSTLPLEIEIKGGKKTAFTGKEGYFYLENLSAGEYTLRVFRSEGFCDAHLVVPESDDIVVNLGELICEPVN